jgi:hypothetical protein
VKGRGVEKKWNYSKTTPKKLSPPIAGRCERRRQQFGPKNPTIAEENGISYVQYSRKPQKTACLTGRKKSPPIVGQVS